MKGAVPPKRNGYVDNSAQIAMRELRDGVDDLRHEMSNHESEMHMFQEKLNTCDETIGSLRQQIDNFSRSNQQLFKDRTDQFEHQLEGVENRLKELVADMQQFKSHSQDASAFFGRSKQKMDELQKVIDVQNQNIESLQAALNSLMEMLQGPKSESSSNTYKVKSGDTLGAIAQQNHTTTSILKDLNNLKNDKIIVGQTLKLP